jgi:hypothetical protein
MIWSGLKGQVGSDPVHKPAGQDGLQEEQDIEFPGDDDDLLSLQQGVDNPAASPLRVEYGFIPGRVDEGADHASADVVGADHSHLHVVGLQLAADALREPGHRELAAAVGRHAPQAHQPGQRGNVQDMP